MIVNMSTLATEEEIHHVIERIKECGIRHTSSKAPKGP